MTKKLFILAIVSALLIACEEEDTNIITSLNGTKWQAKLTDDKGIDDFVEKVTLSFDSTTVIIESITTYIDDNLTPDTIHITATYTYNKYRQSGTIRFFPPIKNSEIDENGEDREYYTPGEEEEISFIIKDKNTLKAHKETITKDISFQRIK